MHNTFEPLNGDDDVILLDKDTFTVSRFKELATKEIANKFNTKTNNNQYVFTSDFFTVSIGNETQVQLNDIQWRNLSIDCQILKVGSKGWQKGKLRIKVDTKLLSWSHDNKIQVCLEFCPDEPTVPESPLDDLRQLPEYKQQP
jgi:hypothetical protein